MFKDSSMKKLILLVGFALFFQVVKGNLTSSFTSVENVLHSEIWKFHSNGFGFGFGFGKGLDGLKLTAENWLEF